MHWEDKGKALNVRGEGPKVFAWKGKYFMMIDVWRGIEVYSSEDMIHWTKQKERILEHPGKGKDDQVMGGHCDIIVNNDKAYIFYFTHPGRKLKHPSPVQSFENRRSVIQLAELKYDQEQITCDRDAPLNIQLELENKFK